MAKTIYGIIHLGQGSQEKRLPNATFRLHVEHKTDIGREFMYPAGPVYLTIKNGTPIAIHVDDYPHLEVTYERELYVTKTYDRDGYEIFHLKENSRFASGGVFMYLLARFLGEKIPGMAELIVERK